MTANITAKELLELLEPDAKAFVEAIEAKPMTTKDHYGDYMAVLGKCDADWGRRTTMILAYCMIKVGGNKEGIHWALKLIGAL